MTTATVNPLPRYLTTTDVAALTSGGTPGAVHYAVQTGKIRPSVRVGRNYGFTEAEARSWASWQTACSSLRRGSDAEAPTT